MRESGPMLGNKMMSLSHFLLVTTELLYDMYRIMNCL
jgi:hypothetical protein